MTSSSSPSYNFNGIDFNFNYFDNPITTTTGLTTAQADLRYLNKINPDTSTVLETFTGGITVPTITATTLNAPNISTTVNLFTNVTTGAQNIFTGITSSNINIGTSNGGIIFFGSTATGATACLPLTITSRVANSAHSLWGNATGNITMFGASLTNTINILNALTSGTLNIASGASFTGNINIGNATNTGKINLNGPVSLALPLSLGSIPTASSHLGFLVDSINFTSKLSIPASATGVAGTYATNTPNLSLPIGTYLMSLTGVVAISAGPTAGSISDIQAGYYYGPNSAATLNTATKVYGSISNYTLSGGVNGDRTFTFTQTINVTTANYYLCGYASYTINTITTGLTQLYIVSYALTRIA